MNEPWQPPIREPDPLEQAVVEAVRTQIFPIPPVGVVLDPPDAQGWRDALLSDGQRARIAVTVEPTGEMRFGARACVVYRVVGHAALDRRGHRVSGQALIDRATGAFLKCECRLEEVGLVAPNG